MSQWVLKLAAQRGQFVVAAAMQNGLGDGEGAAKTGDDAADGRDFDLGGGVADEKNIAIADAFLDGYPFAVDGNARALPFERLEIFLFEEAFQAALGVAALLADDAQSAALWGFGDQPIKIRSVVGDEPDAGGVDGAILGEAHDGLHERNGFNRRPSGGARDAAGGAVSAHDAGGVQLFACGPRFRFRGAGRWNLAPGRGSECRKKVARRLAALGERGRE